MIVHHKKIQFSNSIVQKMSYLFILIENYAKYGSYTMMDLHTNSVIDIQLMQVRDNVIWINFKLS